MPAESLLNDEQRTFVITSLACFDTPTQVSRTVKAEFGIDITRQSIERYDPTKHRGTKDPGDRAIFDRAREDFLEGQSRIGVSHRVVRLAYLDRLVRDAIDRGAFRIAFEGLEKAAKEAGNAYTNRAEVTGANGAPLLHGLTVRFIRPGDAKPSE